jgi:GNAT superfamily N-acetyltransferase
LPSRIAGERDLGAIAKTLGAAFESDPLWSWAFSDPAKLVVWWRLLIAGALRYPWVWVAGDYAATTVWIPPGGTELSPEEEERVAPLLEDLLGPRASEVMELLERFAATHPKAEPHFYLSLLGTHPGSRGHGYGMALLAENLVKIDDAGMPAYLESSNPANITRYEGLGFRCVDEFSTPDHSHSVTTMWRAARG